MQPTLSARIHTDLIPLGSNTPTTGEMLNNSMRYKRVYTLLAAMSVTLYCNTWSADFAFDDNFAVVRLPAPFSSFSFALEAV